MDAEMFWHGFLSAMIALSLRDLWGVIPKLRIRPDRRLGMLGMAVDSMGFCLNCGLCARPEHKECKKCLYFMGYNHCTREYK